jgi:hypothetical protein
MVEMLTPPNATAGDKPACNGRVRSMTWLWSYSIDG